MEPQQAGVPRRHVIGHAGSAATAIVSGGGKGGLVRDYRRGVTGTQHADPPVWQVRVTKYVPKPIVDELTIACGAPAAPNIDVLIGNKATAARQDTGISAATAPDAHPRALSSPKRDATSTSAGVAPAGGTEAVDTADAIDAAEAAPMPPGSGVAAAAAAAPTTATTLEGWSTRLRTKSG